MLCRCRRTPLVIICALVVGVAAGADRARAAIRFLVAESDEPAHKDSYVLPLTDPAAIAHARDLIQLGPEAAGAPIVVAEIAAGTNGINRNYLAPGSPPWSWHVTRFETFADVTIEILDGWPTLVEDDVEWWIANTGGYIGFWRYTVVAELPAGDYNADLTVDLDDYGAWRQLFGSVSDLSADGNGNGIVDAADYTVWRDNLGARITLPQASSSATIAVPEPTFAFMSFAVMWWACGGRRSWLRVQRSNRMTVYDFHSR